MEVTARITTPPVWAIVPTTVGFAILCRVRNLINNQTADSCGMANGAEPTVVSMQRSSFGNRNSRARRSGPRNKQPYFPTSQEISSPKCAPGNCGWRYDANECVPHFARREVQWYLILSLAHGDSCLGKTEASKTLRSATHSVRMPPATSCTTRKVSCLWPSWLLTA